MAVPKSKRVEGQLRVVTKANELANYTIQICSNEKNFPKRYRWCITNKIVDTTLELCNDVIHANAIRLDKDYPEDAQRRFLLQKEAYEKTHILLNLIDIAFRSFGINADRIEYWTGLLYEEQNLLRNWRKSDKERLNNGQ